MKEESEHALVEIIVEESSIKENAPKVLGVSLGFYIGKRLFIAAFATAMLCASLLTIKVEKNIISIENRNDPNIVFGLLSIYLLGVSTDLDLTLPLKAFKGQLEDKNSNQ